MRRGGSTGWRVQLLGREREYIQLHRDTTVQSLTVTPSLKGGVVHWEDSPLVHAVREGRVLVVDEAVQVLRKEHIELFREGWEESAARRNAHEADR